MGQTANFLPRTGIRFKLYARPPEAGGRLEPIHVQPHGPMKAGPADDTVRVVHALWKETYKEERGAEPGYRSRPYYRGQAAPPVPPGPGGHFDDLAPGTPAFSCANVFATVRCVEAIWEHHFGRKVPWDFLAPGHPEHYPYLEVIPFVESENSWSGAGYVEFGYPRYRTRLHRDRSSPFCENFDAIAHEMGHLLLRTVLGPLPAGAARLEQRALEEACCDLVAVVASLTFDAEVDALLAETRGQLSSANALSRIAEWSAWQEIRELFNETKMADVLPARRYGDKHWLSLPFSEAAYDVLVALYVRRLMTANVIPANWGRFASAPHHALVEIQQQCPPRYPQAGAEFKAALLGARDDFATLLVEAWTKAAGTRVSHSTMADGLLRADQARLGGAHREIIRALFAFRGLPEVRP